MLDDDDGDDDVKGGWSKGRLEELLLVLLTSPGSDPQLPPTPIL